MFCVLLCMAASGGAQDGGGGAASQMSPPTGVAQTASPSAQGSIHGIVASRDGAVYEGVHVELSAAGATGSEPARAEATDSDGAFSFAGLPAGSYRLTFSSEGFTSRTVTVQLGAGQIYDTHEIVLQMAGAATEVKVSAESPTVELAHEQLHIEEQQRVLGVIPNYYVTYEHNAAPLDARQKYQLAWRSSIDPVTFLLSGIFAGVEQTNDEFSGYGQGAEGYAKRFGANYTDGFVGTMIGGAMLPSLFRQDPRYFYKGTGTVRARTLYALANAVICKGDNGRWQFNYSGVLGSLAAGGISNLYYPASNRSGVALTFENAGLDTVENAVDDLFEEFVLKKFTPKAKSGAGQGAQ